MSWQFYVGMFPVCMCPGVHLTSNVICLCEWQSVGGGMLQTWLDMSSKMHMSFSFPQLMAFMPTRELRLLELDTHREAGMHMTKQPCYNINPFAH
jgi:hypothetical protein